MQEVRFKLATFGQNQFQLVTEDLSDVVETLQSEVLFDYKSQVEEVQKACSALKTSLDNDYSCLVCLLNECMTYHFEEKVTSLVHQLKFLVNMC